MSAGQCSSLKQSIRLRPVTYADYRCNSGSDYRITREKRGDCDCEILEWLNRVRSLRVESSDIVNNPQILRMIARAFADANSNPDVLE